MNKENAIEIKNLSKEYRLGVVSTGTLSHDLNRWWHRIRGKEDPYLKVGEANVHNSNGNSEYVWALKDINLKVRDGEVLGIIGKNGAGKSTLLKILSKVTGPTTGEIRYRGRIGSLLEVGTGFHAELTGRENIFLNGAILGMTKEEIKRKFDEIVDFSGCARYMDTPVKRYSSGMMVRLGFAVAAFLEPEILVVDEVLAVGDAEFQKKAIGKMKDVSKNDGRTVLFVSHNMGAVRNLCKTGIVLEDGNIGYYGTSNDAIDYYINQNSLNQKKFKKIDVTDTQRMKGLTLDVQILSLSLFKEKYYYSTDESISILYSVKGNRDVKGFRINAKISSIDDQPIGVFLGNESFDIKENEIKEILVTIENHFLTLGTYKISTSVGKGNFVDGMTDFDVVLDAIQFKINTFEKQKKTGFTIWNRSWGNILFKAKCAEFNS